MATVVTTNLASIISADNNLTIYQTAGTLIGTTAPATAIDLKGHNHNIILHGAVFGESIGVRAGSVEDGVLGGSTEVLVGSTGTVDALQTGMLLSDGLNTVTNHGLISAARGIRFQTEGDNNASDRVFNFGTIRGVETGIDSANAASLIVDNLGIISGRNNAIVGSQQADAITNAGTIFGNLFMQGGDDEVDTAGGTITGITDLGLGNDTYTGSAGIDRVVGGGGDDVVNLGAGDDFFFDGTPIGNDGNDTVDGGDGIDTFVTSNGFNTVSLEESFATSSISGRDLILNFENVRGGSRADTITGNNVANVLIGNQGGDLLIGLAGDDRLIGGAGRDTLDGGIGRDVLTGGSERDFFVFNAVADSPATARQRDIITDFETGIDRIDLSGIDANANVAGNQAFSFIGAAAFSSGTPGQVRSTFNVNTGKTLVEADVNGDAVADFAVQLTGLITLQATDFIL